MVAPSNSSSQHINFNNPLFKNAPAHSNPAEVIPPIKTISTEKINQKDRKDPISFILFGSSFLNVPRQDQTRRDAAYDAIKSLATDTTKNKKGQKQINALLDDMKTAMPSPKLIEEHKAIFIALLEAKNCSDEQKVTLLEFLTFPDNRESFTKILLNEKHKGFQVLFQLCKDFTNAQKTWACVSAFFSNNGHIFEEILATPKDRENFVKDFIKPLLDEKKGPAVTWIRNLIVANATTFSNLADIDLFQKIIIMQLFHPELSDWPISLFGSASTLREKFFKSLDPSILESLFTALSIKKWPSSATMAKWNAHAADHPEYPHNQLRSQTSRINSAETLAKEKLNKVYIKLCAVLNLDPTEQSARDFFRNHMIQTEPTLYNPGEYVPTKEFSELLKTKPGACELWLELQQQCERLDDVDEWKQMDPIRSQQITSRVIGGPNGNVR
ncbi:MAG: hypothetical protein LBP65_00520 [Puniceicoccales bacterium]|jgi:hypothetical protein|nr:hypothetical protein [Puniceicoccales bacterium]